MINIGLVGFGYWGPNLVRNFMETAGAAVRVVADLRPNRLDVMRSRYPSIQTTTDYSRLRADPSVDAVAIATPVGTHFEQVCRTLIGGERRMIVYDDLEPSEKAKVYDWGVTVTNGGADEVYQLFIGYRTGDMWAPQLEQVEALSPEVKHFVECIEQQTQPLTDGHAGIRVVQLLSAADQSLQQKGTPVELRQAAAIGGAAL